MERSKTGVDVPQDKSNQ